MDKTWYLWVSTPKMTIGVAVREDFIVVETPPIARRFIGQPIGNLYGWLGKQGVLRAHFIGERKE